ncbi:MarR family transcriptional regulator [Plantactinospora veratri]
MAQPAAVPVGAAVTAVRQASLREHNLALVLRQIATAGRPPSRADLATATGLTRATVSALVDDLITGRLLTEVAPTPGPAPVGPRSASRSPVTAPPAWGWRSTSTTSPPSWSTSPGRYDTARCTGSTSGRCLPPRPWGWSAN